MEKLSKEFSDCCDNFRFEDGLLRGRANLFLEYFALLWCNFLSDFDVSLSSQSVAFENVF